MIVEAAFALAGINVDCIDLTWRDIGWRSGHLQQINMLGQVPTVITPDGCILTESGAILMHIHDECPTAQLLPSSEDKLRVPFLRWFFFINAAIYPTYTYGDIPTRWVSGDKSAGEKLRSGTNEHVKELYLQLEKAIEGPWFLGYQFSALDLYIWKLYWWRPGREWHEANCPKLFALGERVSKLEAVMDVAKRNFPEP